MLGRMIVLLKIVLLATVLGEFLVPFALRQFYAGYDARRMVMNALGSPESPVRRWYNAWLLWLGAALSVAAFALWGEMRRTNPALAALTLAVILLFAVDAGIIAGIFSVNESKSTVTVASKIHGAGAAIGFMAPLFFPLLYGIWQLCRARTAQGTISAAAFALVLAFFACFILGDKERFSHTALSYGGVWERLTLAAMYVPFALWAAGAAAGR